MTLTLTLALTRFSAVQWRVGADLSYTPEVRAPTADRRMSR